MIARIQWFRRPDSSSWYVSDLPGCIGRTPDPRNPQSDWGYTDSRPAALDLTAAEMARLRRYRRDVGGLPPVEFTA